MKAIHTLPDGQTYRHLNLSSRAYYDPQQIPNLLLNQTGLLTSHYTITTPRTSRFQGYDVTPDPPSVRALVALKDIPYTLINRSFARLSNNGTTPYPPPVFRTSSITSSQSLTSANSAIDGGEFLSFVASIRSLLSNHCFRKVVSCPKACVPLRTQGTTILWGKPEPHHIQMNHQRMI